MKFELVRNLKGDEILSETIYGADGRVLLTAGTKLTKGHINVLKQNMIFTVHLLGGQSSLAGSKRSMVEVKEHILNKMPEIFKGLMLGDGIHVKQSLDLVVGLIDYIIDEGEVNTNLYEINKYDDYTYSHCVNTGIMATILGIAFKMNRKQLEDLGVAAVLHDIGKTKIPSNLVNKKGAFTEEEFEEMKKHPMYGFEILLEAGIHNNEILNTVMQHHERMNSTGYPMGLRGEEISINAKILAVCDVFTAISAHRSYRTRFNPNEAYEYIIGGIGTLFDEKVVNKFKQTFSIYPIGYEVILSNGMKGKIIKQNRHFPDRPIVKVNFDVLKKEVVTPFELNLLESTTLIIEEVL